MDTSMKNIQDVLQQSEQYLREINDLAKQQKKLIRSGDFNTLISVLKQKELLVKEIAKITKAVKKNNLKKYCIVEKLESNTLLKITDIANAAKKIIALDHDSLHSAMVYRNIRNTMLGKIAQGRKLIHRYRQKGSFSNYSKQWNG